MQSSQENTVADAPYLELLPEVDDRPIFIMGDHRSGTTLLYKTLAATDCFNFVKAYHIIKYDEILSNHVNQNEGQAIQALEAHFKALGISDRTIDTVMATPNLPEEYGFILKNVVGDESFITPKNFPVFQQLCRKIQYSSVPDKPLLLKNPWEFPQFMTLKQIVPSARFVFIHRHPIHVMNSKLKAARSLLSAWNPYTALLAAQYEKIFKNPVKRTLYQLLYSKYFDMGLRQVRKSSVESTSYFLENIESLSDKDYVGITYEGLCEAPKATIEKILAFLALESRVNLDYPQLISPRAIALLPEVKKQYAPIRKQLQPYFSDQGYET